MGNIKVIPCLIRKAWEESKVEESHGEECGKGERLPPNPGPVISGFDDMSFGSGFRSPGARFRGLEGPLTWTVGAAR